LYSKLDRRLLSARCQEQDLEQESTVYVGEVWTVLGCLGWTWSTAYL